MLAVRRSRSNAPRKNKGTIRALQRKGGSCRPWCLAADTLYNSTARPLRSSCRITIVFHYLFGLGLNREGFFSTYGKTQARCVLLYIFIICFLENTTGSDVMFTHGPTVWWFLAMGHRSRQEVLDYWRSWVRPVFVRVFLRWSSTATGISPWKKRYGTSVTCTLNTLNTAVSMIRIQQPNLDKFWDTSVLYWPVYLYILYKCNSLRVIDCISLFFLRRA
jgi:hypothetical protein